ncbi:myb/SANT-like domain-containing protein [Artemisia annua]|uniref:Myb/SANT-like domain-containing protein n=1 Tax=Artemisia annua TaxID=35608 RepID=A0A2U1P919_ARTAN|nr:myb/SANT-like domain-containing protein [Artemisia annua]
MACDQLWKTDGDFRSNYLCEVHKRILIKMPTFSKQVPPHIKSKVKWLKAKYHVISDMLKHSGCQWNDVENNIACERDWYDGYCAAKGMWDLKFPFFNQHELLYGKDRAIGGVVEGFGYAIRKMENERNVEIGGENIGEYIVSLCDDEGGDVQTIPTAPKISNARNLAGKKNKIYLMETRVERKGRHHRHKMSGHFASKKFKDVLAELAKLKIPIMDVLDTANIFSANKEKMDACQWGFPPKRSGKKECGLFFKGEGSRKAYCPLGRLDVTARLEPLTIRSKKVMKLIPILP